MLEPNDQIIKLLAALSIGFPILYPAAVFPANAGMNRYWLPLRA